MASDTTITKSLRQAVRRAIERNEEITINGARAEVEKELGLDDGFFKSSDEWKSRSKEIISAAFEDDDASEEDNTPPPRTGTKRKSSEPMVRPKKRSKRDTVMSEEEDESEDEAPKAAQSLSASTKIIEQTHDQGEESDMSSLIDEDPAPKKKRQKKNTSPGPKKVAKPKTSTKALSPDEEQVKTLQSQLVKCGVRKLWHRELAHCKSTKDKIRHLKTMLADVGMTGRFSAEKAEQIKEARELAADMESAKEFQKTWGVEADTGRGRRRRAASKSAIVDIESDEEDASEVKAGPATGLVDFGDSGDDGSD